MRLAWDNAIRCGSPEPSTSVLISLLSLSTRTANDPAIEAFVAGRIRVVSLRQIAPMARGCAGCDDAVQTRWSSVRGCAARGLLGSNCAMIAHS
jgi:hypothetical protein